VYVGHTTLLVRDICRSFFGCSMANELGVVNTRLDGMLVIELMPLALRAFNSSHLSNSPPSPSRHRGNRQGEE